MEYGCIGEHLLHSFSKEIHECFADYRYDICEVARDELHRFMTERKFRAINVTIPYKQDVIPYLDRVSDMAREIGAVNTIVNKDGKLYGHNTDFFGMTSLIKLISDGLEGMKVIILGTGGTSRTARAVAKSLGAAEVVTVSRSAKEGCITYDQMYDTCRDASFLINTTPCGMFPNTLDTPVDISRLPSLKGVCDAIYNPLRTELISDAISLGIPAVGGLYMLVAQAVAASAIFTSREPYPEDVIKEVYEKILSDKENIVLIGMPGCGKSTVGKLIAERLGREFIDTDEVIVKRSGEEIKDIFASKGEKVFRDMETEAVKEVSDRGCRVIAVGGGAVLRDENVRYLKKNGRLIFLDRPVEQLIPTESRPLASDKEAIMTRYRERYPRYTSVADDMLKTDGIIEHACDGVLRIVRAR